MRRLLPRLSLTLLLLALLLVGGRKAQRLSPPNGRSAVRCTPHRLWQIRR
ncbi:hypothetical protein [Kallotenue papyrolyticum]|nr:hypothetical protein [Kallotenue papyrolyticum]